MWFPKWEKAAEELKIEKETIDEIEKIEENLDIDGLVKIGFDKREKISY